MNLTPRKDELRESPFNPRVMNGEALEIESWNSCNSPFRSGYSLIEMLVYISVLAVLMGVGYIIGFRISCVMVGGGVLAALVLTPAIAFAQSAAEVDQQPVAVIRLEQLVIVIDIVERLVGHVM